MKLSQVMLSRHPGARERYFRELCRRLAGAGHEVQAIIDRRFAYRDCLQGVDALEMVEITALGGWDPLARHALATALEGFRPDLVETHTGLSTRLAERSCRQLGLPLVIRLHEESTAARFRSPAGACYLAFHQGQSQALAGAGVPAERIRLVHGFCTTEPAGEQPVSKAGERFYFAAAGCFTRHGGFHYLLRALRLLLDQELNVHLLLVGDGPERNRLRSLARRLKLERNLTMPGGMKDPRTLLECADAFVLPALREAFGFQLLEAMAAGVPTIATNLLGPLEILDEELAWLVEPGDPVVLCRAMQEAVCMPPLRVARARKALERCREAFLPGAVLPYLCEAYRLFTRLPPGAGPGQGVHPEGAAAAPGEEESRSVGPGLSRRDA